LNLAPSKDQKMTEYCLIVRGSAVAALDKVKDNISTVIVGQYTDLLVIATAMAPNDFKELWFLKPGKSNGAPISFSIHIKKVTMGEACELLLSAHAMTGCDTTSALYAKGKN
jgi:hypothetical protein